MSSPLPKRSQDKKLREREDLVRRSPILNDAEVRLWVEIARGWAWDDKSCFPSQETLARALGWSVRKVKRYLSTLREKKLVLVTNKSGRGNKYDLPDRIPISICSPARLINKNLSQMDLGTKRRGTKLAHRAKSGRPDSSPDRGQNCPPTGDRTGPSEGTELAPEDELREDEHTEDELSEELRATSRSRPTDTKVSDSEQLTKGSEGEINSLLQSEEEAVPKPVVLRKSRGRRSASKEIVPKAGEMHDKPPTGEVISASPPELETPENVLTLFADEIRDKYGKAAFDTIDLNLETKEKKKIEHGILAKFKPHVVIGMVRVLVWDWEVIRDTCWPYQRNVNYPRPEFLMTYRAAIASAVPTGFEYTGAIRGAHMSYAQRYLSSGEIIDDPF